MLKITSFCLLAFCCAMLTSCRAAEADGKAELLKLSLHDKVGYCDLAVAADGVIHALFTDQPAWDKPLYLYYTASRDGGASWSQPDIISDDESGEAASYARVLVDGAGRAYAIWKYVHGSTILDGPGGTAAGRLVYRCLDGAKWSRRIPLGEEKIHRYSWFATRDAGGSVHVAWSQIPPDAASFSTWTNHASLVRQATLDGATASLRDLRSPKPLLTEQEQAAMKAAGNYPPYEETTPRMEGVIDLRGVVAADGAVRFTAKDFGVLDAAGTKGGDRIVYWDGEYHVLYEYPRFETHNTFNNPTTLLQDGMGRLHVMRAPEKAARPVVRDYPLEERALADPTDAIAVPTPTGTMLNWQAHALADGSLAVTAAISLKGGYRPDDVELYLVLSSGDGVWSEPLCLTDNAVSQNYFRKETGGSNAIAAQYDYIPRHAALARAPDGDVYVLMVNNESTLLGITNGGVDGSGRAVSVTSVGRVDSPAVYFTKVALR